jgi:hypothetical protein
MTCLSALPFFKWRATFDDKTSLNKQIMTKYVFNIKLNIFVYKFTAALEIQQIILQQTIKYSTTAAQLPLISPLA